MGDEALDEVKAVAVESWLSTLKKDDGAHLADGSEKKIRDLMHLQRTSTQSAMNGRTAIRLRLFGEAACARQHPSSSALTSFPNLSTVS